MKEKIRLINVMHLRSGSGKGFYGAESVILSICKNIDKEKFNCVICCFKDSRIDEITLIDETKKINIPGEIIKQSFRFDLSAIFKLKVLLNKYNIDILHCHDYKANFIGLLTSLLRKVRLVTTLHGWRKVGGREKFYEFIDSIAIKCFHQVVAVSQNIKENFPENRLLQKKITVVHNGVAEDYFGTKVIDKEYKKNLGISEDMNVIGTVGRLSKEKGQNYLIEAAGEILNVFPNTIFIIAGDGPFKENLLHTASSVDLEKHIIFTGLLSPYEIKKIYSLIDIFILPSLTEGICLALLEAMAMGIPVIATAVGGNPEVVDNGKAGFLVPPADSTAIAKVVIELLKDKNKYGFFSTAGKNFVKKEFSCNKMVKEMEEVYKKLI